jgi:hypothetical protein
MFTAARLLYVRYKATLKAMETIMGIPSRFAIEYPQRALKLIAMLELRARHRELLGSFGLLAASAVLTIPYERMKSQHFLHKQDIDSDLAGALKRLQKTAFLQAPFWEKKIPGNWWQSRIFSAVQNVDGWRDKQGLHPFADGAVSKLTDQSRTADEVIRVLRNALAHGNVIYLDREFRETPGEQMVYMAFLSRYEETHEHRTTSETYRLVVTGEEEFLNFVKCWASWIGTLDDDGAVSKAA